MSTSTIPTPKTLPVVSGSIYIPTDLRHTKDFNSLKELYTEVNHLLCLLGSDVVPDTWDEDGDAIVSTDNLAVLKYAHQKGYIDEFSTVIDSLIEAYHPDHCCDCMDEIIEANLCRDFEVELVEGKLCVVFKD